MCRTDYHKYNIRLLACVALVLGSANWYQQSPRGRKPVGELIASFGTLLDEEFDQCILLLSHVS